MSLSKLILTVHIVTAELSRKEGSLRLWGVETEEGKSICRAVGIESCKQLWLAVPNTKGKKNGRVFNKMKAIPGTFPLGFFFPSSPSPSRVAAVPNGPTSASVRCLRGKEKINKITESGGKRRRRLACRGLKQRVGRLRENREGRGRGETLACRKTSSGSCPCLPPPRLLSD